MAPSTVNERKQATHVHLKMNSMSSVYLIEILEIVQIGLIRSPLS